MQFKEWLISESKKDFNKKLIHQFGKIKVYRVDDEAVRNSSHAGEEFGASGTHSFHPKVIPSGEIWIADSIKQEEVNTLIHGRLNELKYVEKGKNKYDAYHLSVKHEKQHRRAMKGMSETKKEIKDSIYIKKYGNIGDIEIWIVNGEEVRNHFKTDFIEAGHFVVYPWIPSKPQKEIWIEQLHEHEMPYILLHEYVELVNMKNKKTKYDPAHIVAAKVEYAAREKGNFTKKDILSMTEAKAEQLNKKYA